MIIIFILLIIMFFCYYIYIKKKKSTTIENFEDDNNLLYLKKNIEILRGEIFKQNKIIEINNEKINNLERLSRHNTETITCNQNKLIYYSNLLKDVRYNLINEEVKNKKITKECLNKINNKNEEIDTLTKNNLLKDEDIKNDKIRFKKQKDDLENFYKAKINSIKKENQINLDKYNEIINDKTKIYDERITKISNNLAKCQNISIDIEKQKNIIESENFTRYNKMFNEKEKLLVKNLEKNNKIDKIELINYYENKLNLLKNNQIELNNTLENQNKLIDTLRKNNKDFHNLINNLEKPIQKNSLGTCPDGWKYNGRGICETTKNQCGNKNFFGDFNDVDKLNWAVRCNSTWSNEKQLSPTEYAPNYTLKSITPSVSFSSSKITGYRVPNMIWSFEPKTSKELSIIKNTDKGYQISEGEPYLIKNSYDDCMNQCTEWNNRGCNAIEYSEKYSKTNPKKCKLYKLDSKTVDKTINKFGSVYGDIQCNNNYKNMECCGKSVWSDKPYFKNAITIPWCPKPTILSKTSF